MAQTLVAIDELSIFMRWVICGKKAVGRVVMSIEKFILRYRCNKAFSHTCPYFKNDVP